MVCLYIIFLKKTLFKNITQKELDKIVKLLNNRPRKRLNYLTPNEVFKGYTIEKVITKSIRNNLVAIGV